MPLATPRLRDMICRHPPGTLTARPEKIVKRLWLVSAACLAYLGTSACSPSTESRPVTLFAAASTEPAMVRIIAGFEAETGIEVRAHFAASSALARQLALGATADLVLLANTAWMDDIARKGVIAPGSTVSLLSNSLVFVVPAAKARDGMRADEFTEGPFSMADPAHVPCGLYGRSALEAMGLWETFAPRLLPAVDARAALAIVEMGEADLGLVYASDAAASRRVEIIETVPVGAQPKIRYPLALTQRAGRDATRLYERLLAADSREIFLEAGFLSPDDDAGGGR